MSGAMALWRDRRGTGAGEFALVLPLLIMLLLGIVDAGRLLYITNMAEKATQVGARYAIVTTVIPTQLVGADYVGSNNCGAAKNATCTAGDPITNEAALGKLTCTSASCVCSVNPCPASASIPTAAFTTLVGRMQAFYPGIAAGNVRVIFRGSGLGFAGDPNGMQVIPLVTVELTGLTYQPLMLFRVVSFSLNSFSTTLTAEDSHGTLSN